MKIGIYSGSFDPVHTGHAMVASYVAQWGGVDEVWMLVSRQNPLKDGRLPAADSHRLEMVRMVAGKISGVRASDFELSLPLPSYTYVTLQRLKAAFPQHDFSLVVGSDNWDVFNKWRDSDRIISEFGVIIYPRPGYETPPGFPENVEVLQDAPQVMMSSSFIRKAVAEGRDINFFVPCEVADYIESHKLYT